MSTCLQVAEQLIDSSLALVASEAYCNDAQSTHVSLSQMYVCMHDLFALSTPRTLDKAKVLSKPRHQQFSYQTSLLGLLHCYEATNPHHGEQLF